MDLSVVIVEYRNTETLKDAVFSIQRFLNDCDFEIIVVSNSAYPVEKQRKVCADCPTIEFIFNQHNTGFSKGINKGVKNCSGEFVLLLNPDAKFLDDSFSRAIESMRENPRIGLLGPQVIDRFGKIQDSIRNFMTLRIVFLRTFRRFLGLNSGLVENNNHSKSQQVDWISGACILVRRNAIYSVGIMDERYFMYVEDMDWCRRFWQCGWEVWYQPDWKIEHNSGRASTKFFNIGNKLMWIHLVSFCKYYLKWLCLRH